MVIESILNPLKAEKNPWEMFFIGFLYSTVGILLSIWIFKDQPSLIMVFLTVMACVPIVYNTLKLEEKKDTLPKKQKHLLLEHSRAIIFLMFLFVGVVASCSTWYVFLPKEKTSILFDKQIATIEAVNSKITGHSVQKINIFSKIFFNNMAVLAFAILFSLIYGAGAIFILTWNATVISAAIGNTIKSKIAAYAASVGLINISHYFSAVSIGVLRYVFHGVPEILGYFYGGLAGGIISVAIIRHHYTSKNFSIIIMDASELILIAVCFIFVGALIETFITPLLF